MVPAVWHLRAVLVAISDVMEFASKVCLDFDLLSPYISQSGANREGLKSDA